MTGLRLTRRGERALTALQATVLVLLIAVIAPTIEHWS